VNTPPQVTIRPIRLRAKRMGQRADAPTSRHQASAHRRLIMAHQGPQTTGELDMNSGVMFLDCPA